MLSQVLARSFAPVSEQPKLNDTFFVISSDSEKSRHQAREISPLVEMTRQTFFLQKELQEHC